MDDNTDTNRKRHVKKHYHTFKKTGTASKTAGYLSSCDDRHQVKVQVGFSR